MSVQPGAATYSASSESEGTGRVLDLEGTIWDAIVIGAGPAGSLAARRLSLAGASVLLVDKKPFPAPRCAALVRAPRPTTSCERPGWVRWFAGSGASI